MITKYELCEIVGYPEIISHIVDVSSVVTIRLKSVTSYGFTISLDNCTCVNVSKEFDPANNNEVFLALSQLRENLLSNIVGTNPSFLINLSNPHYQETSDESKR